MIKLVLLRLCALPPPSFPDAEFGTGLLGALGPVLGMVDIIASVWFPIQLVMFREMTCDTDATEVRLYVLSICCLISLATTMISTLVLAINVLGEIGQAPRAAAWLHKNQTPVAVLVLVSLTRLENLRVLKSTVWGWTLLDLPIEEKHFEFLKRCG